MILNTLFVQNKIQPHTHKYDSDIHANLNNKMMIKRSVSVCLCGIKIKERLDLNFYYIFFSVLLLILKKKVLYIIHLREMIQFRKANKGTK